ncbi:MAG: hypothetical protein LBI84_05695 [Propionibacteriaceae bacterium]|nr:hypothetical protein [Propionibacteriaceae bacterium]
MSEQERGLDAQQELGRRIGEQLLAALPPTADEIRLIIRAALSSWYQGTILLFKEGVEVDSLPDAGSAFDDAETLRDVMATENGGTWFSAVFTVFADGRMSASFNYDEEPQALTVDDTPREIMPALYARDFDKYPRSPKNTPAWLAEKVAAGRKQLADIENDQARQAADSAATPPAPDTAEPQTTLPTAATSPATTPTQAADRQLPHNSSRDPRAPASPERNQPMASDSFSETRTRLRPKLYGREHVELDLLELSLAGHSAALQATRPAGPDVTVGVVIDQPNSQTRVSEITAQNWGLPFGQILEAALDNPIGRQIQVEPLTAEAQMIRDPVFAACVWLKPSLLEGAVGPAARVIVTPTADLTLTGAYTPQTMTVFAGVIDDLLQAGEHLETITPAYLGPHGWETVAWPASGVNPILWNRVIALFADQLSGRQ